jgi:predicted nucleic acid-binding protein
MIGVDRYVLDCSLTMCWAFTDEATPATDELLVAAESSELVVPSIWFMEVGNALNMAQRRNRVTKAQADLFVSKLLSFNVVLDLAPAHRSLTHLRPLAQQHNLTVYDAAYLDLAIRLALPLATQDAKLRAAAAAAGVAMVF